MKVFIASTLILLAAGLDSRGAAAAIDLDIGSGSMDAELVYGWHDRNESIGENSYRWILGRAADLRFGLSAADSFAVEIVAHAFYYDNCRQSFALYANGNYIDEWVCRHDKNWEFHTYRTILPAEYLQPGTNSFSFRMAYESHHRPRGYSLAVARIGMSPEQSHSARQGPGRALPSAAVAAASAVLILFLVFRAVWRM